MGMTVEVDIPPVSIEFVTEVRRAMLAAAETTVLPAAVLGAPYEDEPKHNVHLRDTAFVRLAAVGAEDVVEVGFRAYWAAWQHERLDYHHEHGHAKFLELAMVEQGRAWLDAVAAHMRERFK